MTLLATPEPEEPARPARWRPPRFAPTRRFALLIALLAPVWLLLSFAGADNELVIGWSMVVFVAALLLGDALLIPPAGAFLVRRELPPSIGAGDVAEGMYSVTPIAAGAGERPWRRVEVTLHDAIPAQLEDRSPPRGVQQVRGPASLISPLVLRGRDRGAHPLGPVALRVVGPLRLAARILRYEPGDALAVVPSVAGIQRYRLLALQHRLRDAGVRNIRKRGEGSSFASLREYVVGDDPRRIDWKATARRRKLITREYTVEQGQTIIIAVDAGRLMTQFVDDLPRFEYALSSAVVLADVAVHSGDRVGLIVFDDRVRALVSPMRGKSALHAIREAVVPVRATMAEPDYASAFRTLAMRNRRRSLIVVITDVIDTRASQALIANTTRSARRHLPVVVALRNDKLVATALPHATDRAGPLYESAAAEELLLAREEVLARMRHAGVATIDVSPHAMTAAVINHYLAVKARSAL